MPARKIFRRPDGEKAVRCVIELYPSRGDLICAVARKMVRYEGGFEEPATQAALLEMFVETALAGDIGSDYDASDKQLGACEAIVDRLLPILREPTW